jgi:hypothetical protein
MNSPKLTVIVTRESIAAMLNNENPEYVKKVVGKALTAIYERQTSAEQANDATHEHNGIGFAGCDAESGSKTAKFFAKHKTLLDWQVDRWTKIGKNGFARLCKYHAQLNEVALSKMAQQ